MGLYGDDCAAEHVPNEFEILVHYQSMPLQQTAQCTAIFNSLHNFKMESPKLKKVSLEVRNAFYVKESEQRYDVLLSGDGLEEGRKHLEDPILGMLVDDKEKRERGGVGLIH